MFHFTRRSALVSASASIALSACVHGAPNSGRTVAEDLDAYFRRYADVHQFAGVALVAAGGRIVFEGAYGAADPRNGRPARVGTAYPLASLSKAFTAAAVVKLAQDGRVRFTDPLSSFLPRYPNGDAINLDLLLRHKSGVGLLDQPDFLIRRHTLDELVAAVASAPPLTAPGDGDYSNEGYVLLAKVIEVASGMSFELYLQDLFFEPLRMRDTARDDIDAIDARAWGSRAMLGEPAIALERDEQPLPGASGLKSTVRDIYAWLRALKGGGVVDYSALQYPYGFGRRTYQGKRLIEQSGSVEGFGSYMAAYEDGHFAVVLSNMQCGVQGAWGEDIAALLTDAEPSLPTSLTADLRSPISADLAGNFTNPQVGYPVRLRVQDNRLEMTWGPYPLWRPMSHLGDEEFLAMADYTRIKFSRQAGQANSLAMFGIDGSPADSSLFTRMA